MPILNPEPGLVISYAYFWHHEHQAGREEGQLNWIASSGPLRDEARTGKVPALRSSSAGIWRL
jgi:hypothetical protein